VLKRIAVISFLFLLLFNAFGYYLLFAYQQVQARQEMVETVKNMPESSFKVIKLLVSAYAHIEDRAFEYVEGEYQSEGQTYNFIKKRIVNDSLELYCVNNYHQDKLNTHFNDYVKENLLNGKDTKNSPTKQMFKTFLKEYISNDIILVVSYPTEITSECSKIPIAPNSTLLSPYLSLHSPPPNVV
jgi:hypothetical protein